MSRLRTALLAGFTATLMALGGCAEAEKPMPAEQAAFAVAPFNSIVGTRIGPVRLRVQLGAALCKTAVELGSLSCGCARAELNAGGSAGRRVVLSRGEPLSLTLELTEAKDVAQMRIRLRAGPPGGRLAEVAVRVILPKSMRSSKESLYLRAPTGTDALFGISVLSSRIMSADLDSLGGARRVVAMAVNSGSRTRVSFAGQQPAVWPPPVYPSLVGLEQDTTKSIPVRIVPVPGVESSRAARGSPPVVVLKNRTGVSQRVSMGTRSEVLAPYTEVHLLIAPRR